MAKYNWSDEIHIANNSKKEYFKLIPEWNNAQWDIFKVYRERNHQTTYLGEIKASLLAKVLELMTKKGDK